MRWVFLFLIFLNAFYFIWFQQQTPLKVKDVLPLELHNQTAPSIKLVSEEEPSFLEQSENVVEVVSSSPEKPVKESVCEFFGGAIGPEQAANLQQRLLGLDIPAEIETAMGDAEIHWLYLPPVPPEELPARLKALQDKQIEGLPITDGVLAHAVSLGIISQAEMLDPLVQRLKTESLTFQHNEMSIRKNDFWVKVQPEATRLLDDSLLKALAEDFAEVQHRIMPCKSVATVR